MKWAIVIFFVAISLASATPARHRDRFLELASATVNGEICFNQAEVDAAVDRYNQRGGSFPLVVTSLTPTLVERNLSTCTLQAVEFAGTAFETEFDDGGFRSLDEFLGCQTQKRILVRRILILRRAILELQDFPGLQLLLMRRLAWLVHFYGTLP